jgi:hypothetical protein
MTGTSTNVILGDALFVIVVILINETDGLKKTPIILIPLMVVAFATCIIRHVNYYKQTKRIY